MQLWMPKNQEVVGNQNMVNQVLRLNNSSVILDSGKEVHDLVGSSNIDVVDQHAGVSLHQDENGEGLPLTVVETEVVVRIEVEGGEINDGVLEGMVSPDPLFEDDNIATKSMQFSGSDIVPDLNVDADNEDAVMVGAVERGLGNIAKVQLQVQVDGCVSD